MIDQAWGSEVTYMWYIQASNLREKFTWPVEKLIQNLLFWTFNNFFDLFFSSFKKLAMSKFCRNLDTHCSADFVNRTIRSEYMALFLWKSLLWNYFSTTIFTSPRPADKSVNSSPVNIPISKSHSTGDVLLWCFG